MSFENPGLPPEDAPADDNIIQTFQLEESHIRGRAVRIGSVLDEILGPHDYPEAVARLVAETIALTLLLSSMLKYEGIFTLQTKSDGAVSMLVADVTSAGEVRGCASYDADKLAEAEKLDDGLSDMERYLGEGYIAFTVDQGGEADRYQGIVELQGDSLVDCAQHYFEQSEQIGTGIKLAVGRYGPEWRAGAIMIQHMPEEGKKTKTKAVISTHEEDWTRSMALLDTCTDHELLNADLHSNALLYRLFHEEGVRVYDPKPIIKSCRCSSEKVENMLVMMPEEDIDYMNKSGKLTVKCEFCSREYTFDLVDIKAKMKLKS